MKRNHGIGWSFLPVIIMLCVQNMISIVGTEILVMVDAYTFTGKTFTDFMNRILEDVQNTDFLLFLNLCYAVICAVWFGIWYYNLTHNHPVSHPNVDVKDIAQDIARERKGWFDGHKWPIIPGMLILAFGAQYLCTYLMNFVATLVPRWLEIYQELFDMIGLSGDSNMTVTLFLYVVLLGPVAEELAFRGLTFFYARRAAGFWIANILQAFLFGAMHLNPLQGIYAFALGLLFGLVFEKSRNILITIVLHILFNAVGVLSGDWMTMGDNAISFFFILLGSLIATYIGYELVIRSIPRRIEIEEKPKNNF